MEPKDEDVKKFYNELSELRERKETMDMDSEMVDDGLEASVAKERAKLERKISMEHAVGLVRDAAKSLMVIANVVKNPCYLKALAAIEEGIIEIEQTIKWGVEKDD